MPWRNVPVFRTASEEETIALGERLAAMLPRRAVVLLTGDLGAGKTTLAKGIVKGLGAAEPEEVSSPTFTLIHEYGAARLPRGSLSSGGGARSGHARPRRPLRARGRGAGGVGRALPRPHARERVEIRIEAREDDERVFHVTGLNT